MTSVDVDTDWYWVAAATDAGHAKIFRLNVLTGAVSDERTLAGDYDFNGWVADSTDSPTLFGLDRESGKVQQVDMLTWDVIGGITWPGSVGEVGGMCRYGTEIYVATGGPGSVVSGSNKLYRTSIAGSIQPPVEVGLFAGVTDSGFSGLATPEPSVMVAAAVGLLALLRRKR